jgi:hypothetical protein
MNLKFPTELKEHLVFELAVQVWPIRAFDYSDGVFLMELFEEEGGSRVLGPFPLDVLL